MKFEKFDKTGVYRIINEVNDKVYYGSTINSFGKRYYHHLSQLRLGKHKNKHLQRSWDKHGEDAFSFEVLEVHDTLEACRLREQCYLDKCQGNCYNINMDSTTPPLTDEVRKVRSKTAKRLLKDNAKFGFSKGNVPWNKGVKGDSFNYDYLKVPKKVTDAVLESRKIRSEYRRSNELTEVEVYTLEGQFLGSWRSAKDLEEDSTKEDFKLKSYVKPEKIKKGVNPYRLRSVSINKCINGKVKSYKSLVFKAV
jgi:group I intron endonuclease